MQKSLHFLPTFFYGMQLLGNLALINLLGLSILTSKFDPEHLTLISQILASLQNKSTKCRKKLLTRGYVFMGGGTTLLLTR